MNLKDLLSEQLILESNQEKLRKLLVNAGKEEYYDKIVSLDTTKNGVFSIKLGKFFLEDPTDSHLQNIQAYFDKFINLVKKQQLKVDFNSIKSFRDFHNLIDATEAKYFLSNQKKPSNDPEKEKEEEDLNIVNVLNKKINKKDLKYIDANVAIVRADNKNDSIRYGSGFSTWCTARKSNNLFYSYRIKGEETMYYVYFLKKSDKDPEKVIHFGLDKDGEISYTDRTNNEDDRNLPWLGEKFPELQGPIMRGIFEYVPLSKVEKDARLVVNNETFAKFNRETKEMYISCGHGLSDWMWDNVLDDALKMLYINQFDSSLQDISDHILNQIEGTQLERRYWVMIGRGLDNKRIDTYHELLYVINNGLTDKYLLKNFDMYSISRSFASLSAEKIVKVIGDIIDLFGKLASKFDISRLIEYVIPEYKLNIAIKIINLYESNIDYDLVHILYCNLEDKDKVSLSHAIVDKFGINMDDELINKIIDNIPQRSQKLGLIHRLFELFGSKANDDIILNLLRLSPVESRLNAINMIINSHGSNMSEITIGNIMYYSPSHRKDKLKIINKIIDVFGTKLNVGEGNVIATLMNEPYKEESLDIANRIIDLVGDNLSDIAIAALVIRVPQESKVDIAIKIIDKMGANLDDESVGTLVYRVPEFDVINKIIDVFGVELTHDQVMYIVSHTPEEFKPVIFNRIINSIGLRRSSIRAMLKASPPNLTLDLANKIIDESLTDLTESITLVILQNIPSKFKADIINKIINVGGSKLDELTLSMILDNMWGILGKEKLDIINKIATLRQGKLQEGISNYKQYMTKLLKKH
jgi:hypothetical protein